MPAALQNGVKACDVDVADAESEVTVGAGPGALLIEK